MNVKIYFNYFLVSNPCPLHTKNARVQLSSCGGTLVSGVATVPIESYEPISIALAVLVPACIVL